MNDENTSNVNQDIPDDASYETLVQELEASVARLESGDLSLEDAVLEYELGMTIIERCNRLLDRAELRVTELSLRAQQTDIERPDEP